MLPSHPKLGAFRPERPRYESPGRSPRWAVLDRVVAWKGALSLAIAMQPKRALSGLSILWRPDNPGLHPGLSRRVPSGL
jgi:hypothetical protein